MWSQSSFYLLSKSTLHFPASTLIEITAVFILIFQFYFPVILPKFIPIIGERIFFTDEFNFFVNILENLIKEREKSNEVSFIIRSFAYINVSL